MPQERAKRRLAAILVADVVGYSRLIEADEEGTRASLRALQNDLIAPRIAADGGRIVKTTGDGVLVEFPSAVDAVRNALDIQGAMRRRKALAGADAAIEFRVGINLGDVIVEGDDIHGEGVNVAARLEQLCNPGDVYVSRNVFEQVTGKVDATFDDLGEHAVKNISRPIRVFRARRDANDTAKRSAVPAAHSLADKPSIAVLPFDNLSNDPDQQFFADGLTEDIITALSHWRSFTVIARNSTFAYKGKSPDVRDVARHLGVRYVLEGSVRKAGDRVRISAQLIAGETGNHVWAQRYDRKLEDFFDLQDEITQTIAGRVEPEFARAEQRRAVRKATADLAAWEWYQRGISALDEMTADGNRRARECLQRAMDLDPMDSAAPAAMAYCHFRYALDGFSESPEEDYANAVEYGRRAVALDGANGWAHFALSCGLAYTGQHEQAIAESRRSVELNPNNASAHIGLGNRLSYAGEPEEGQRHLELAIRLDPVDPRAAFVIGFLAEAHLNSRDYEQAIEWARRSIERKPDQALAYAILASSLGHLGRTAEAEAALRECLRLQPRAIANRRWTALYKRPGDAEHILDGLRKAGWSG